MKTKKQRRLPSNEATRKTHAAHIWRLLVFIALGALISLIWPENKPAATVTKEEPKVVDRYKVIVSKLSKEPVKSRFSPVHIFHVETSNTAKVVGTGSIFTAKNGEEQIVTSEHLFAEHFGKAKFLWRKLRPLDESLTNRGIAKILYRGFELGKNPNDTSDVAILQCGEMQDIDCSYNRPSDEDFLTKVTPAAEKKWLTSLVSGEKVRIVGIEQNVKGATTYTLIEYDDLHGESGTGFIDENDDLYVLKGEFEVTPPHQAEMQNVLGNPKALARAYGPLRINP